MGNKKRARTSPGTAKHNKAPKQLKIDELFAFEETVSIPDSNIVFSIPTANSFSALDIENELSLESAENSGSNSFVYQEGVSLESNGIDKPASENLLITEKIQHTEQQLYPSDFVTKQCLLTANTVISIYERLEKIARQLEVLKLSFDTFTQKHTVQLNSTGSRKEEKPGSKKTTSNDSSASLLVSSKELEKGNCNRILQANQVMLQIANNRINNGRWRSHGTIRFSLSQLLHIHAHSIDMTAVEWLPSVPAYKRVMVTSEKSTIPLMLMKMKHFLSNFQITSKRIFLNLVIAPLIAPKYSSGMISEERNTCSSISKETPSKTILHPNPAKTSSTAREKQSSSLSEQIINEGKKDIATRLEDVKNIMLAFNDLAEPLVNLESMGDVPHAERNMDGGSIDALLTTNENGCETTILVQPLEPNNIPSPHELTPKQKTTAQTESLEMCDITDLTTPV